MYFCGIWTHVIQGCFSRTETMDKISAYFFRRFAYFCCSYTTPLCLTFLSEGNWFVCSHNYRTANSDTLRWRHNGRGSVSNHQPHDCLLNRLFRRKSKKTSKLHVTGLCAGNSPGTGEFPAQMASNAENGSIWWRHHCLIWINLYN